MTAGNVLVGYLVVPIFKHIQKHWVPWLIAASLALNAGLGYGLYKQAEGFRTERQTYQENIQKVKDAQAEAEDKIKETTERLEAKAKIDAKQSDQTYAALLKRYNASLVRYKALESSRSRPSGGDASGNPGLREGASGDTELPAQLTISGDDARICAVNTAKLQALQSWALTLQGAQ